jgi:hypothetical protein
MSRQELAIILPFRSDKFSLFDAQEMNHMNKSDELSNTFETSRADELSTDTLHPRRAHAPRDTGKMYEAQKEH